MAERSGAVMPVSYVQDQGASEQRFSWPSWSPDGQTLLVQGVTVAVGGIAQQAGIYRLDLVHPGTVTPLYENRERGPIYLYFSPTGRDVAVLLTEPGALGLALLPSKAATFGRSRWGCHSISAGGRTVMRSSHTRGASRRRIILRRSTSSTCGKRGRVESPTSRSFRGIPCCFAPLLVAGRQPRRVCRSSGGRAQCVAGRSLAGR